MIGGGEDRGGGGGKANLTEAEAGLAALRIEAEGNPTELGDHAAELKNNRTVRIIGILTQRDICVLITDGGNADSHFALAIDGHLAEGEWRQIRQKQKSQLDGAECGEKGRG